MPEEHKKRIDQAEFIINFVSHEIKNPLSAVIMFTRLFKEGAYGEVSDDQQETLDRILANAARIDHMTSDFLTLSSLESGDRFLQMEDLDFYDNIILPAITSLEKNLLFSPKQTKILKDRGDCGVRIRADRRLMTVVYDNLLFNAIKYGRQGGEITLGCREEPDQFVLNVYNEGQGVREEDLEFIFERFVRLKDPNMPSKRGTGLGLYNVRRIIEMHGGRIWPESEYGRYFNVLFTLPRDGSSSKGSAPPADR